MVPSQSGDASWDFDQLTLSQTAATSAPGKSEQALTTEALTRAKATLISTLSSHWTEAGALKAAAAFDAKGDKDKLLGGVSHRDQGQYRSRRAAL